MRIERLEARLVLRVLAARIQRRAAGEHEAVDQLRTIEGQLKTDRATHAVADKVLKGLAEYLDLSLGDLLEGSCSTPSSRRHPSTRTRSRSSTS
jgi:hypothetical protein